MEELSQEDQYQVMHGVLNERQWRLYVATEARRRGTGGISQVAREAGVTRKTIRKGMRELEAGALYEPGGRMRRKGGGRKQITDKDESLRADLEETAGAERRSAEPGAMDEQIDEQAQRSAQEPRTYDWRDRHPGIVKRDGIFPQSEQEEGLRERCMPTETPNFSRSIAPGKPLKQLASQ